MGFFAGRARGHYFMPNLGIDLEKVKSLTGTAGQSNYTGTGVVDGYMSVGQKGKPKLLLGAGGYAGFQTHLQQNVLMSAATNVLIGFYGTITQGNVVSTNGELVGSDLYVRNPGTGTAIAMTGGRFMLYVASGAKTKYKKGLLIDVLDLATSHPASGGTQGILLQMNATSIVNNQVDCILINQNSSQFAFSGITFKGKIGAAAGNGAVINFLGSGDQNDDEGNKQQLFKFRTGGDSYIVTPAQFKAALGANLTEI